MNSKIKKILATGENIRIEYKESYIQLPENLFESICAMLNRDGGDILLGVKDNGVIKGIDPSKLEDIRTNIINLSNNPEKLLPPFILFPKIYNIDGKDIIHIQIPSSSQIHKTRGVVFDRSGDGDYKQELFNVSRRTIVTDLNRLEKFIVHNGSKKTGGYVLRTAQ